MEKARLVARVVALLILVTGCAATVVAAQPRTADYPEFARALDSGSVDSVVFDESDGTVSDTWIGAWSTGLFQWRRGPIVADPVSKSQAMQSLRNRGVEISENSDQVPNNWAFRSSAWFGMALTLAWLGTFVAMLASRPRWGNRWAWFWMFTVGQVGVLLYLLIEPASLWKKSAVSPCVDAATVSGGESTPDTRVHGWRGLLYAVFLALGTAFFVGAVGWLRTNLSG
ncbi:MAG: hypothetical protein WBG39_00080 [Gordonia sp. (in: high G+C Gram-positive bacteria)]